MTTNEILTLVAIVLGPIIAVSLTLWIEGRRRSREQQLTVLRLLLATRHLPSDPNFGHAVNLIPVEFGKSRPVMEAYKEFIEAAYARPAADQEQAAARVTATKSVRLIYEVSRCMGFGIRETDIEYSGYTSTGWVNRDEMALDSQRAMRDIANILWVQTRLLGGETWDNIQASAQTKLPDAPKSDAP